MEKRLWMANDNSRCTNGDRCPVGNDCLRWRVIKSDRLNLPGILVPTTGYAPGLDCAHFLSLEGAWRPV